MRNDLLLPRTRIEGNQIYSFGRPYKTIVGLEPSYRYVSRMNGHKCAYLELKTTKSYLIAHRKYVYRCLTDTKILLWSFASNSTNTDECWNGFPRKTDQFTHACDWSSVAPIGCSHRRREVS